MIECIVVEDEPLAVTRITDFISRVPSLKLVHTFDNGLKAMQHLARTRINLLFLDIQIEGLTGIEMLEVMAQKPDVILTTAYDQYAVKAFEFSVIDYLVKPFSFPRFLEAVSKGENKRTVNSKLDLAPYIFIKTELRLEKVFLNDILFIEGMRDYRGIHLRSKKILTLQTFSELEETLTGRGFCRIHKSYMVSLSKIDFVERDRIRIADKLLPISDTYKTNFYKMIS